MAVLFWIGQVSLGDKALKSVRLSQILLRLAINCITYMTGCCHLFSLFLWGPHCFHSSQHHLATCPSEPLLLIWLVGKPLHCRLVAEEGQWPRIRSFDEQTPGMLFSTLQHPGWPQCPQHWESDTFSLGSSTVLLVEGCGPAWDWMRFGFPSCVFMAVTCVDLSTAVQIQPPCLLRGVF